MLSSRADSPLKAEVCIYIYAGGMDDDIADFTII